jgi:hypothetical protein
MLTWVAIVAGSLWLRQVPSAVVVGFPAGLWVALAGRSSIAKKRAQAKRAAALGAADDEENTDS